MAKREPNLNKQWHWLPNCIEPTMKVNVRVHIVRCELIPMFECWATNGSIGLSVLNWWCYTSAIICALPLLTYTPLLLLYYIANDMSR